MTQNHQHSCRIARRADKQGARTATKPQVALDKSTTEEKALPRIMRTNRKCTTSSLNTQTMRSESKMGELIPYAKKTMQDMICIQEHRLIHDDTHIKEHANENWKLMTCSAWNNSINTSTGGIGMLISPLVYDAKLSHKIGQHYNMTNIYVVIL